MLDLKLSGNRAVVIGGANGIGLAIATAFAQQGADVAILDRSINARDSANRLTEVYPIRATAVLADVTVLNDIEAAAKHVETELGHVDHLVYAAGTGSGKVGFPFWNVPTSDWPRVISVNLVGAANAAQVFGPSMAERGGGSVLFIASIAGQIGSQTDPPYSAAKAGLINFAICAAKDLAPHNVRVNTICPGMIQTELNKSVWKAWFDRQPESDRLDYEAWGALKVRQVAPLGRWQDAEEIGSLAVYLASPHARNVTGQVLNVDGGQVMHW